MFKLGVTLGMVSAAFMTATNSCGSPAQPPRLMVQVTDASDSARFEGSEETTKAATGSRAGKSAPGGERAGKSATADGAAKAAAGAEEGSYEHVYVTFNEVSVAQAGEVDTTWIVVSDQEQTLDLMTLDGGTLAQLGLAELEEGLYTQIRLLITSSSVVIDGAEYPVKIPSGTSSGVKIQGEFSLQPDVQTEVTLDFDAEESISYNKGQGYMMTPVVKLLRVDYIPADPTPTPGEEPTEEPGDDDASEAGDDDDSSAPSGDDDDSSAPSGDDDDSSAPSGDDDDSSAPSGDDDDSPAPSGDDDDSSTPSGDDDDSSAPSGDDDASP